jgi:uncharacterized membrane protein (DUF106 family)
MEILIAIAPILIVFVVGCVIISIQEWITDMRFYRRQSMREIRRAARSLQQKMREDACLGEVEYVTTTMSTGEVETLGPGKVYVFGGPKAGTVTGTVGYEQLEEMGVTLNEAEKLIKEAHDKSVN